MPDAHISVPRDGDCIDAVFFEVFVSQREQAGAGYDDVHWSRSVECDYWETTRHCFYDGNPEGVAFAWEHEYVGRCHSRGEILSVKESGERHFRVFRLQGVQCWTISDYDYFSGKVESEEESDVFLDGHPADIDVRRRRRTFSVTCHRPEHMLIYPSWHDCHVGKPLSFQYSFDGVGRDEYLGRRRVEPL